MIKKWSLSLWLFSVLSPFPFAGSLSTQHPHYRINVYNFSFLWLTKRVHTQLYQDQKHLLPTHHQFSHKSIDTCLPLPWQLIESVMDCHVMMMCCCYLITTIVVYILVIKYGDVFQVYFAMLDAFLAEEKMPEEYLDQTQVLYLSIYLSIYLYSWLTYIHLFHNKWAFLFPWQINAGYIMQWLWKERICFFSLVVP